MAATRKVAIFLAAIVLVPGVMWGGATTGRAATAKSDSDVRILAEINSRILDARAGYFFDIEIDIVKGDVLLTGRVGETHAKARAAALVRSVPGVGSVINEIRTGQPTTLRGKANEADLEQRVSDALYRAFRKTLPGVAWRVVGDTAYIFGESSSEWVHSRVFTTVKRVKGIGRIVDHLRIAQ